MGPGCREGKYPGIAVRQGERRPARDAGGVYGVRVRGPGRCGAGPALSPLRPSLRPSLPHSPRAGQQQTQSHSQSQSSMAAPRPARRPAPLSPLADSLAALLSIGVRRHQSRASRRGQLAVTAASAAK